MEESKFLEAQNLENQIRNLENILKNYEQKDSKICISWPENTIKVAQSSISARTYNCIENHIQDLPKNIENKVIQLINNELEKLKEEFELL